MLTREAWRNEAVLSLRQATGSRQPSPPQEVGTTGAGTRPRGAGGEAVAAADPGLGCAQRAGKALDGCGSYR
jgi:hypothetical protein